MKFFWLLPLIVLSACGGSEVVAEKQRPDVSYQDIQPAAGMTYPEFRRHETWGEGDMRDVQKRFLILDRNNDGRLSDHELGGN